MPTEDLSREFLADGPVGDDRPPDEDVSPRVVLLKIALFAGLFVGVFSALYYFSEHFKPVYPMTTDRARLIHEEAERFEAFSVGPSHTSSIDFDALGFDGLYLWRGGMDYFQVNYVLNAVENKLPNAKFVFIPAPMSVYSDNFAASGMGEGRRRETYVFGQRVQGLDYVRLMRGDFDEVEADWKILLQARLWPIARPDSWEDVIRRLRDPSLPAYKRTTTGKERQKGPPLTADSIRANALKVSSVRLEKRFELIEYRPEICEIGEELMHRIADKMGPDVVKVFFTHTSHPAYVDTFTEANRKPNSRAECTPAEYAKILDREREDVIYIDLRYYEPISSEPTLNYSNGDHFRLRGSYLFTSVLRDRLVERVREDLSPGHPARELLLSREPIPFVPKNKKNAIPAPDTTATEVLTEAR